MIWTVFQVNVRRLVHNRVELMLTFIVPIAFFSIFAVIFGGGVGSTSTSKIKVIVLDQADTPLSRGVAESLRQNAGLRFVRDRVPDSMTTDHARELVRRGTVTLAIVLCPDGDSVSVDLLADASDQVAGQVATALVGQTLMAAQAERAKERRQIAVAARGASDTRQRSRMPASETISRYSAKPASPTDADLPQGDLPGAESSKAVMPTDAVRVVDVMGEGKANPVVSMYAAGIAVMFLLFGATGGGGALLEERESQTLDRLLSTRLSMDQLLLGKWFYMSVIGVLQVCVMFLWGQVVFGVDLVGHFDGFLMMTVVTASAASAFGLFLATLCRTRGQLNGLSVILVLTMSALGGSMVPRYLMSPKLQNAGLWTFNAWALDGYDKVFWRELPVASLAPQLCVLMGCGLVFLIAARGLAVRWEAN
jgi:ABC-2 type transport system permease protein